MDELPRSFVAGPQRRAAPSSSGRQRARKRRRQQPVDPELGKDQLDGGSDSRGASRKQDETLGRDWRVGDAVEVLWHGKPYDATVRAINEADAQALVAYDPPFDCYPAEWRYCRDLRPLPEFPAGYIGLERRLVTKLSASAPQHQRSDLTYLTEDRSSWVVHVRGWHPVGAHDFETMWALHPPSLGRNTFHGRSVETPRYFCAFGRSYSFSGQVAEALPLATVPLAETTRQRIKALLIELDGMLASDASGSRPTVVGCRSATGDNSPTLQAATALSYANDTDIVDEATGLLPPAPNGVLVNWYSASHYIGLHRDDTRELVPYAPIWSVSWGHPRLFCLRPRYADKRNRNDRSSLIDGWGRGERSKSCTEFDANGHRELEILLGHGDLLIMGGRCQSTHKHEVPKLACKDRCELEPQLVEQHEGEARLVSRPSAPTQNSPPDFFGRRINLTFRSFA